MTPRQPGTGRKSSNIDRSLQVSCLFALYPLGTDEHMDTIYEAIDRAKRNGEVRVTPVHFATRLDGHLDDVLRVIREAFDQANAPHVVIHATISGGSPTKEG
jgi:uncharacterized protein YqgV (UPF0045/DUF77 family)